MKARRLMWFLLFLLVDAVFQLPAQQGEADSKQMADVLAKAEAGDAAAQYNLGICYHKGQGVEKDHVEAVKWFRKAVGQDHALAQYNLGVCCDRDEGVGQDAVEAVKWFRKAAEQDCALAQVTLAACCYDGQGVSKDYVQAYRWWLLAAGHGNEVARKNVAILTSL